MAERWITKNGRRIRIRVRVRRKTTATGVAVASVVGLAIAGGAGGIGAFGGAAGGAAPEALAGNLAGDVVDSLPGRSLETRRASARESAKRGKAKEAWSRLKLKELKRVVRRLEREGDCVAAASGKVREFLVRTPCTALDRMVLAVGDGHGNAAAVSVVRVGFRTAKQAKDFEKVEAVQGSGDVRPLEIAVVLGIANVRMTGLHYRSRPDGTGMVVAEADTATGHVDGGTLDALADVAVYLPVKAG